MGWGRRWALWLRVPVGGCRCMCVWAPTQTPPFGGQGPGQRHEKQRSLHTCRTY